MQRHMSIVLDTAGTAYTTYETEKTKKTREANRKEREKVSCPPVGDVADNTEQAK